jgi:uncharacterized membrane protein YphA (DoxX/SURF4 family)
MDFKKVIIWAVTIFLGLVFVMSGANKLTSQAAWQERFVNEWGLPTWLVPLVGLAEVLGGLGLMLPRLAVYGGSILVLVMLGATGTHVAAGQHSRLGVTIVFGVLASFIAYYRCPCRASDGGERRTSSR